MSFSAHDLTNRLPPANLPAEMGLLGALLRNNQALDRCEGLRPEHFADREFGKVFEALTEAVTAGRVVDAVSLQSRFDKTMLASLLASMVGIINVADYAKTIRDSALARRAIEIAEALVNAAWIGGDLAEAVTSATRDLDALSMGTRVGRSVSHNAAMDSALAAYERALLGKTAGISTGFRAIDDRLGGLEPKQVYVLAGRPGMGKSALGHQIALHVAGLGIGVLELALEMSAQQLGQRSLSTASGVPLMAVKRGRGDAEKLVRARHALADLPLEIDDTASQTAAEIASKARARRRNNGLGLVMIDHLNLVRAEDADARHGGTWATERASSTVLQIAKDCECPVLLLAQLNRGVEAREDKRPTLSDLRQAGAIEQDAYAVGFVYRAEYYMRGDPEQKAGESAAKFEIRRNDWADQKARLAGKAELIFAKVRDGEPGTDRLLFDGPTATFSEASNG